jgi:hypothetical protein
VRPLRTRWWTPPRYAALLAVLVGLLGAGLVGYAVLRESPPTKPPTAPGSTGASEVRVAVPGHRDAGARHGGVADRIQGLVLPAARPVSVSIPRLHISSRLVSLGVDDHGAMEVPKDPATAGWFRPGPMPGALGPAVIAGHVTWNQVPAVFFRLAELRAGDVVRVARDDGQVAVFGVTKVQRYPKVRFPTRAVFGGIDHAGLRLITCGGQFDNAVHRYRDNVVAFAQLESVHRGGS